MDKKTVDEMIARAEERRRQNIVKTEKLIDAVLEKYEKRKACKEIIISEDDALEMERVRDIRKQPEWYNDHDNVWSIFMALRFGETSGIVKEVKALQKQKKKGLSDLQTGIDPWKTGNIRTYYERLYLDTDWVHYDGHLLICDPFDFITLDELNLCPSLMLRDTLRSRDDAYAVVADDEKHSILGTVIAKAGHIGIVLADEILAIPSAHTELVQKESVEYTFLHGFNGDVRCTVTQHGSQYEIGIEGRGSHNFRLNRVDTENI